MSPSLARKLSLIYQLYLETFKVSYIGAWTDFILNPTVRKVLVLLSRNKFPTNNLGTADVKLPVRQLAQSLAVCITDTLSGGLRLSPANFTYTVQEPLRCTVRVP